MTNDDKQFFRGLMSEFGQKWDVKLRNLMDERDQKWDKRFAQMDQKWDKRFAQMDQKWDKRFAGLKDELSQEIRHNGILIENMQDDIQHLYDTAKDTNRRVSKLEVDVADIKYQTADYPMVKKLVKEHQRKLINLN